MRDYALSDNQDFDNGAGGLTSTGEKTDDVFDLEVANAANDAIITDDQGIGYMNVTLGAVPAQATIAGTQGLVMEVRTAASAAMTMGVQLCGAISVIPTKVVSGAKFSVPFKMDVMHKFLGGWLRAYNTAFVGTIYADVWFSNTPIGENASIQKVPS